MNEMSRHNDVSRSDAERLGESDTARMERQILTLRRLTDLAMGEAERLAAAPSGAVGETALALHRLTRLVRLNIALEQKLIEDLRNPGVGSVASRAAVERAAHPARKTDFAEILGDADDGGDGGLGPERRDELAAELRRGLDTGDSVEDLITKIAQAVSALVPDSHGVKAEMEAVLAGGALVTETAWRATKAFEVASDIAIPRTGFAAPGVSGAAHVRRPMPSGAGPP
jgi:hypothetical protein